MFEIMWYNDCRYIRFGGIILETVVYISRHAEGLMKTIEQYNSKDSFQVKNEKNPLSVNGEEKARKLSECDELKDIDVIYSSHYVRTMATAKYIANKNNLKLNVDSRFGERVFGINDFSELPSDFFYRQLSDWNYKICNGESLLEVCKRMNEALEELLNLYKGKRVVIVSHGTSLSAMLAKWCDIKWNEANKLVEIYFKDKLVFDGNWNAPELFKLIFDNEFNLKV